MPVIDSRRPPRYSGVAGCLLLAMLPLGLTAQATPRPARSALEPSPALKKKLLAEVHPELPPEALEAKVRRLEAAWLRAKSQGLLTGPEWQESLREGRLRILEKAFLDHRPAHPAMTEPQVQAAFLAQGDQRRVLHLLCPTEAEAAAALKRIQAGEPFGQVAAEVSKDLNAKTTGGDLGWIRRKEVVASFADPVFAAPIGGLVGPIRTDFGWHVATTLEVHTPTVAEFLSQREALLKQAADARRATLRDLALGDLRRRYPLKPELAVLADDPTPEIRPEDGSRIAGRVAGTTISLKALKRHLSEVLKTMGQSHALGTTTKVKLMEGLADQVRLAAAAEQAGLDRRPEVRAALWIDARESAIARFSAAFLGSVQIPEADLEQVYSAHPDRFRPIGGLRLQVLVADTKDRVEEALLQIRAGMAWRKAVERYASAESTGNPEPGWVEVESLKKLVPPSLLQPLLQGPLSQPVGPMLGPDGFMLFNVLERKPGPVLPLPECREAVRTEYLKEKGNALVERELDRPSARP